MAGKNWQAGGKILIPARAVLCLIVTLSPCGLAWGAASGGFAPAALNLSGNGPGDVYQLTSANFLRYVREGFYNNTLFHRVVANFVIQGGGHDATTMKLKTPHENIVNESGNGLQNKRGAVGLARGDAPHSGNAQFYVDLVDNSDLDPVPTRWGYTVFGRIVQGMEVIDRIGETPTGAAGPFKSDAPLKPVIIEKMEIVAAGATRAAPELTPVPPPRQDTILSPK